MAFADYKVCFMAKYKAYGCSDYAAVDAAFTSYDYLPTFFFENIGTFECNPALATDLFSCITGEPDDTPYTTRGIWFNHTETTINDPVILLDTTADLVQYTLGADVKEVAFLGPTTIVKEVNVTGGFAIGTFSVSGGAIVNKIGTTGAGSCINYLRISMCKAYTSKVELAVNGSCIGEVNTFGNPYSFGGFSCIDNVAGTCGDNVTGLAATDVTTSSFRISWVNDVNTSYRIIRIRTSANPVWSEVNDQAGPGGFYVGETGFVFNGLQEDTYYDIQVINVCANGVLSSGVIISQKTN